MNTNVNRFNPLALDHDLAFVLQRSAIRQILMSYNDRWDVFAEALQNALDAGYQKTIDERSRRVDVSPIKIWIEIDVSVQGAHRIRITDNGIGMNKGDFMKVFSPWVSTKQNSAIELRGQKGVGATFLAYGFNDIKLESKQSTSTGTSEHLSAAMRNGRQWIEGRIEEAPEANPIDPFADELENENSGTSVEIILSGDEVRPRDLTYEGLKSANAWAQVLQVKTGVGQINLGRGPENEPTVNKPTLDEIEYFPELTVKFRDNPAEPWDVIQIDKPQYLYPHEFELEGFNQTGVETVSEIERKKRTFSGEANELSTHHAELFNLWAIWDVWSGKELVEKEILKATDPALTKKVSDSEAAVELLVQKNVYVYAVFLNSTRTFEKINQSFGGRSGLRFIEPGYRIATAHMVQGERGQIELVRNIGYQNNIHIIFHGDNLDPDIGRKNFSTEFKAICDVAATRLAEYLIEFRQHLRSVDSGTGAPFTPGSGTEKEKFNELVTNDEFHLKLKNLNLPIPDIPFLAKPTEEQDVIVLFNQLLTAGAFKGYEHVYTSVARTYDAGFLYEPTSAMEFNENDEPLGIGDEKLRQIESDKRMGNQYNKNKWVEFKLHGDDLLTDFDNQIKSIRQLDLLICWRFKKEDEQSEDYDDRGYKIRHFERISGLVKDREFFGATHQIIKNMDTCEVISLEKIVDFLKASCRSTT